jgi:BMFP domain-containing protein YqiC
VRLTVGGTSQTQPFTLLKDPRIATTQADFDAQFQLLINIRDTLSSLHDAVSQIRDLRGQVDNWSKRASDGRVTDAAKGLQEQLTAIEDELIQVRATSPLNFPSKLKEKLAILNQVVSTSDFAPTQQSQEVFASLRDRVDQQLEHLDGVLSTGVGGFNSLLREVQVPAVVPLRVG